MEENPSASEADLEGAFGSPEKCAADLLAECDPALVEKSRRKRRLLLYAVIAALLVVILGMAVFWVHSISHQVDHVRSVITEYTYVEREKDE